MSLHNKLSSNLRVLVVKMLTNEFFRHLDVITSLMRGVYAVHCVHLRCLDHSPNACACIGHRDAIY